MINTEEKIKEIWKKLGIEKAIFTFNCGGDSMNHTELDFIDINGNELKVEYSDFISDLDNLVYENVEFYETSSGGYMGEFGEVEIFLEDDEFIFDKNSKSELYGEKNTNCIISLTEEQISFFKNVQGINYEPDRIEEVFFIYKKNIIVDANLLKECKNLIIKELNEFDNVVDLKSDQELTSEEIEIFIRDENIEIKEDSLSLKFIITQRYEYTEPSCDY